MDFSATLGEKITMHNKMQDTQFFKTLFVPRVPFSIPGLYFIYYIRQDTAIRTRVAATAARCATNELHA